MPSAITAKIIRPCVALVMLLTSAVALPGPAAAATALRAAPSVSGGGPTAHAAAGLRGLNPNQIRSAYALPARGARGQTIAIISAYDDPYVERDLRAYNQRFGLPACTLRNGCLRKLNDSGKSAPLPPTDLSGGMWITESAVGTELAHGLCQSCRILLVEASSDSVGPFSKAVKAAAIAGAGVIVTTFTPPETPDETFVAGNYDSPRSAIVAAVGDPLAGPDGYTGGLSFPASLPSVLAVGGTHLTLGAHGRYSSESAWRGTVSGCSLYEPVSAWQIPAATAAGCRTRRVEADLAAVADPGAIVHITGAGQPGGPWYVANGTSLSAPVIGAVIGLAGSVGNREAQMLYQRQQDDPGAFHDIRSGTNAPGCRNVICAAGRGWDGPTGLGTPAGLEAFLPGGPVISPRHARVTVSAPRSGVRFNRSWNASIGVANGNAFRISGTIVLRRTVGTRGRQHVVQLGQATLTRGSLQAGSVRLTIARADRGLLTRSRKLTAWAFVRCSGAAGRPVTVKQQLTLVAP